MCCGFYGDFSASTQGWNIPYLFHPSTKVDSDISSAVFKVFNSITHPIEEVIHPNDDVFNPLRGPKKQLLRQTNYAVSADFQGVTFAYYKDQKRNVVTKVRQNELIYVFSSRQIGVTYWSDGALGVHKLEPNGKTVYHFLPTVDDPINALYFVSLTKRILCFSATNFDKAYRFHDYLDNDSFRLEIYNKSPKSYVFDNYSLERLVKEGEEWLRVANLTTLKCKEVFIEITFSKVCNFWHFHNFVILENQKSLEIYDAFGTRVLEPLPIYGQSLSVFKPNAHEINLNYQEGTEVKSVRISYLSVGKLQLDYCFYGYR